MASSLRDQHVDRRTAPPRSPRIVIAHDYLTQRGGAERVVLALATMFPDAPIVTSIYNPDTTYVEFRDREIRTSWLSRTETFRRDPRRAFPLLGPTWSGTRIDDADVVLCSSTGWAHGVKTTAPKIVYCHNPARWLYQAEEYLVGTGRAARAGAKGLGDTLRRWDHRAAHSAATYLANSSVVADRIAATYGIKATVVHPPSTMRSGPLEPIPGLDPGFLLTVGRSRGYKNTAVVAEAVSRMPSERLVAVGGLPPGDWPDRVRGITDVTDGQLRWLYENAAALVACAYEDFGLTPIEAYSMGTPAVVLRAGGYLDTMIPGVSGEFIASPDPDSVENGIRRLRRTSYSRDRILEHADAFSPERFAAQITAQIRRAAGLDEFDADESDGTGSVRR